MSLRASSVASLAASFVISVASQVAAETLSTAGEALGQELAAQLAKRPKKEQPAGVAVVAFQEGDAAAKGLGAAAADAVAKGLAGKVTLVARPALEATLAEKKLAAGGVVADEALGDVQKLAAAQALLVGTVRGAEGRLKVSARIVNAEKGVVLATHELFADAPPAVSEAPKGEETPPAVADGAPLEGDVEASMRRLADRLAATIKKSLPESARYSRIAVTSFEETGELAKDKQLGTVVPAELSTYLLRDHGFLLVERAQLAALVGELKLGASGMVPEEQAPQLGKLAGAQALVIGQVSEAGDRFLVNARVVETDTGRILGAEQGAVPAAGLVALSSDAVVLRSTTDAVYRSLLLPGWGQFYNREPVKGAVFGAAEVALIGGAVAFHLMGSSAEDEYANADADSLGATPAERSAKATELREDAESDYRTRNVLLGVAGAVWVYNVLDAWMNGVDGESMVGGRGGASASVGPDGVGFSLPLP